MTKWTDLKPYQQKHARNLFSKLVSEGVSVPSVSQVGAHYDLADAWDNGTLTLTDLCTQTGWDAPPTEAPAEPTPVQRLDELVETDARVKRELPAAMLAVKNAEGDQRLSTNEIARRVATVVSRPTALRILGEASIADRAETALTDADYEVGLLEQVFVHTEKRRVLVEMTPPYLAELSSDSNKLNTANHIISVLREADLVVSVPGTDWVADMTDRFIEGESLEIA